ncbi:MAG: SDR family NAD(P)-dependent oxidoreductase, partial [Parasphingorhabdus sp.]
MAETKVALVTGASRGAGAGIARGFGELGYTVYVTGRTITPGDARGWDGTVLPGTVAETAAKVTELGGKGIPVMCDHGDDEQVAALFKQIEEEQGQLDVLVNNAAYIHHQLIEKKPFWEKELDAAKILDVGLRSAYVASWHAAKMMVKQGSGVIAF